MRSVEEIAMRAERTRHNARFTEYHGAGARSARAFMTLLWPRRHAMFWPRSTGRMLLTPAIESRLLPPRTCRF